MRKICLSGLSVDLWKWIYYDVLLRFENRSIIEEKLYTYNRIRHIWFLSDEILYKKLLNNQSWTQFF